MRYAKAEDTPCLISALNDWSVAQWLITPPFPYQQADAEWFVNWSNQTDESGFNAKFVIAEAITDELLGVVTLLPNADRAELGYWLRGNAHNQGYMTAAIKAVIDLAKTNFQSLTCFAKTDPQNYTSQKCLLANGFTFVTTCRREDNYQSRRGGSLDYNLYELKW